MKKIAKLSVAVLCVTAITGLTYAAKPGTYIGAGLGESMIDKLKDHPINHNTHHNKGLAGRLFAGYNFNEYFGIESGLAKYGQYTHNATWAVFNPNNPNQNAATDGTFKLNLQTFDVVAKGYLPIQGSGFNLYGLAGLAYTHVHGEQKLTIIEDNEATEYPRSSHSQNSVHPIYGVGVSYDIPQTNFVTNLELTRLQGSAKLFGGQKAPNANMLTFNVAYNFD